MITQRYGDLEVAYTTQWRLTPYFDAGLPATEGSWRVLSSVFAHRDASTWSGNVGGLLVKDLSSGQDLLKPPVDFKKVGRFEVKPPFSTVFDATVWRPVPPAGYVALGDVAIVHATVGPNSSPVRPDAAELGLVCVKQTHDGRTYVRRGELGRLPLRTNGSGKALWAVTTPLFPADDTEERLLLLAATFSCGPAEQHAPTAVTWVLDLPAAVDRSDHDPDLTLTSYNPPPAQSIVTDRTVTVPYHMVKDDARTEAWKVANSPFYKVQRKRRYDLVRHVDFRGSGGGTILEAIQQGVSQEMGQEFSANVGISVGVTAGVEASVKPFGLGASAYAEATVSASLELGYTSRYSVSTFENKTVSVSYDVPPGRAGALWTDTHLLVPVRGDGTLVTNANLKLNSGSYVGRTFPHLDGTKIVVTRTFSDEEIKAAEDMGIDPKILIESDVSEIQQ
ncbi:hypothetical protein ACKI1J_12700 [Streptomyces scabiei]|uniref:hypothetical protein n=1 Tax=Streptomyces scabiei TaxID=1930 RepID=UPI0038F7BCBA